MTPKASDGASMKGGLYIPPNRCGGGHVREALAASMKGGLYIPPNEPKVDLSGGDPQASMKGGLYIPPNVVTWGATAMPLALQ